MGTVGAMRPVLLALVLAVGACGGGGGGGGDDDATSGGGGGDESGGSADAAPIRVGVVTSQTGPYAVIGEQTTRAVTFAVEEANEAGGIDGRPVEMVTIDDQGTPEGAVSAMERAIQQEDAPFITGTVASSQSLAMAGRIEQLDGIYIATVSKTDVLTGESCSPRVFRANKNDSMDLNVVAPWLEERPEQSWAVLAADYEWGFDSSAKFTETAEAQGRTVAEPLFSPLGTTDFGSYIAQLQATGADGLWVSLSGGDANNFAQQAAQFGLLEEMDVVIGNNFVTDATMKTVGDVLEGVWGTVNYSHTIDTPSNEEFVAAWSEAHGGDLPTNFEGETYVGMQMLFQAVEEAGSIEPEAVAETLSGLEVETLFGPGTVRAEDHQLVSPNYVGQVVTGDVGLEYDITVVGDAELVAPEANPDCVL